jgi:hypothetical protein
LAKKDKLINKRISYILKEIASLFGVELQKWVFDSGNFKNSCDSNFVYYSIKVKSEKLYLLNSFHIMSDKILKTGFQYIPLSDIFPLRWLYEDFEEELIKGKELFEKYKSLLDN